MKYFRRMLAWGIGALILSAVLCGCASVASGKVTYYKSLKIREHLLDRTSYNLEYKYGNPMPDVRFITIHNTWNVSPAVNERAYLNRRKDKQHISFHFAVDEREAIQILPLDVNAWHAGDGRGDGNMHSIGVEICRSRCVGESEWRYRMAETNGVLLAAYLLRSFNLPLSALRKHQDWSGKICPHRIIEEKRWEEFKSQVGKAMQL